MWYKLKHRKPVPFKHSLERDPKAYMKEVFQNFRRSGRNRVRSKRIGKVHISTVFLGLDHAYSGASKPVLFETMVFGLGDEPMYRCCTWREALRQHRFAVAETKQFLKDREINLNKEVK